MEVGSEAPWKRYTERSSGTSISSGAPSDALKHVERLCSLCHHRIRELEAENASLRRALERIRTPLRKRGYPFPTSAQIAAAALNPEEEE